MKQYVKQLSFWAHWRFPNAEADEIVEDYQDILTGYSSKAEATEHLGSPRKALMQLEEPKSYRWWCLVFFGLVFSGLFLLHAMKYPFENSALGAKLLFPVILIASLLWFRRFEAKPAKRAMPRRLLPVLSVELVALLFVLWFYHYALSFAFSIDWLANVEPWAIGPMIYHILRVVCLVCALAGGYALLQARMQDRRWIAVYLLALTVIMVCMLFTAILNSLDLGNLGVYPLMEFFYPALAIAAVGGISVGVALC